MPRALGSVLAWASELAWALGSVLALESELAWALGSVLASESSLVSALGSLSVWEVGTLLAQESGSVLPRELGSPSVAESKSPPVQALELAPPILRPATDFSVGKEWTPHLAPAPTAKRRETGSQLRISAWCFSDYLLEKN